MFRFRFEYFANGSTGKPSGPVAEMVTPTPIDGGILMIATVKVNVGPRVGTLVDRTQFLLEPRVAEYPRQYAADGHVVYLAETGHWEGVGDQLGRESEFEAALEIRDPVVIATE